MFVVRHLFVETVLSRRRADLVSPQSDSGGADASERHHRRVPAGVARLSVGEILERDETAFAKALSAKKWFKPSSVDRMVGL